VNSEEAIAKQARFKYNYAINYTAYKQSKGFVMGAKREILADGKMLRALILQFEEKRSEQNLID
jgi:hypothetical protein